MVSVVWTGEPGGVSEFGNCWLAKESQGSFVAEVPLQVGAFWTLSSGEGM